MSILVVCPGCHKSFRVSDKFAGKSGACPKCKAKIDVPAKVEDVTVHAPTAFEGGGRTTTGKLVTKPVARQKVKFGVVGIIAVVAGVLTVVLVTFAAGGVIRDNLAVLIAGLLAVSPAVVVAAYAFLRNEDLEPYRGRALYLRSAACAVGYVVLWGVYGYISSEILSGELFEWLFVVPPFLAVGGGIALASLDLDFGSGFFHYAFYLLVTVLLRWAAGMGWIWEVAEQGLV